MKTHALTFNTKRLNKRRTQNNQSGKANASVTNKDALQLVQHLHQLVTAFPHCPSLLRGKVRRIKIEPHYRESRSIIWGQSNTPKTTCKIRLTGNWIAKAGFAETNTFA